MTGQYVWCADLDNETIGFSCAMCEGNTPQDVLVDNLHLLPMLRDRGVGKRLMGEAAHWTVAQGITQLYLLAYEANTTVIGFYKALGGVSVSRDRPETTDGEHAQVRTCR